MFLTRMIRKRWVLFVILTLSIVYLVANIFFQSKSALYHDIASGQHVGVRRPFVWQPKIDNTVKNQTRDGCRNTIQGKILVVDDRGAVCKRSELLPSGCCMNTSSGSEPGSQPPQHTCSTCNTAGCCAIYEHCVSCCLRPEMSHALSEPDQYRAAPDTVILLLSQAHDHYDLCTIKCRTSSQSVYHENTYRDPKRKHCYGESNPDLVTQLKR